ncbi:ribosome hibernation-promoting factor, HPF/YfiA family [Ferrovibrio sp.]|uniref:ribosome hibernation-promoting factor, HPF/YfiA family n=1 Tax=Ferrovibrio sp. TaxID=1917215 RepID=UPI003D2E3196
MKILISGKQVDLGDALRGHVEMKLIAAVSKYMENAIEANVVFSREGSMFRCACAVHVGTSIDMQADASDPEIYASFDQALDKLAKQVRRDKRKRRNHHARKPDLDATV